MNFQHRIKQFLPLVLLLLCGIAISIKGLREPDAWWQLRTGEWILENKSVPSQDIFSYTFAGAEWFNVKWLSEVLMALVSKATGPECIFLLQILATLGLLWVLYRTAHLYKSSENDLSAVFTLLLLLPAIEYRIIGRPEMVSHLLCVVFVYLLLRYRSSPSKSNWWLVALQVLWANMHEAFGMGIVLTAIFTAGAWLEFFLVRKNLMSSQRNMPKELSLVLLLQICSLVLNPRGVALITKPLNIFGQVFENKYTTELFDFRSPEFWQWNVYWLIAFVCLGAVGNILYWKTLKSKTSKAQLIAEHYGLGYFIAFIAFVYLALTAYRNVIFLALITVPFVSFGVRAIWSRIFSLQKLNAYALPAVVISCIAFYMLIVSNSYYKLTGSRDRFGFQVLNDYNPVQAADFVRNNRLQGKCFSDYLTSSYLLWRLQPDFKTFIDLRDLDVFPSSFFNTFAEAVTFPEEFEKLDSIHHFSYIVLYRPQFTALHKHLYNNSRFKMAYIDNVAVVYIPESQQLIDKTDSDIRASWYGHAMNLLLNPFFNITNKQTEADATATTASYFLTVGSTANAEKILRNAPRGYLTLQLMGEVQYNRALQTTGLDSSAKTRDTYLAEAQSYYRQSLELNSEHASAYMGLGAVQFKQQNYIAALENFESAIRYDETNLNAWLFAAECCKVFVNRNNTESNDYAARAIYFLEHALSLNPDNPPMMLNLGLLHFRLNHCAETINYLKPIQNFEGFSAEEKQTIVQCISRCDK